MPELDQYYQEGLDDGTEKYDNVDGIDYSRPWAYAGKPTVDPDTGGMKGRKDVELFTAPPLGLTEYGKVCSYGSRDKYAQNNWRYGFVWSLSANALLRHYLAWVGGEDNDPESGLHHMAHAAWHALVLVQFSTDHPTKDDRFGMPAHPVQGELF